MIETPIANRTRHCAGFFFVNHHQTGEPTVHMTIGVKHLADEKKAYWLLDAIASYQPYWPAKHEEFQVWILTVKPDQTAVLEMNDGNSKKPLVRQEIEYTDYPLEGIKLYVVGPLAERVLMLPEEY